MKNHLSDNADVAMTIVNPPPVQEMSTGETKETELSAATASSGNGEQSNLEIQPSQDFNFAYTEVKKKFFPVFQFLFEGEMWINMCREPYIKVLSFLVFENYCTSTRLDYHGSNNVTPIYIFAKLI